MWSWLRLCSLPHLPLFLGNGEKRELEIGIDSLVRLARAYGGKDEWVGKAIMLVEEPKEIQDYPMKARKLRYEYSLKSSVLEWYVKIRAWLDMNIVNRGYYKEMLDEIDDENEDE
jgi:hypothetical protein